MAFEAFWWQCIVIRADDLQARCPFAASGTPAAAEGASDGAMNAEAQIDQLLKKHSGSIVQQHLRRLASTDEARKKMRPYDR